MVASGDADKDDERELGDIFLQIFHFFLKAVGCFNEIFLRVENLYFFFFFHFSSLHLEISILTS